MRLNVLGLVYASPSHTLSTRSLSLSLFLALLQSQWLVVPSGAPLFLAMAVPCRAVLTLGRQGAAAAAALTHLKVLLKATKATHIFKWGHRYRRKSVNYTPSSSSCLPFVCCFAVFCTFLFTHTRHTHTHRHKHKHLSRSRVAGPWGASGREREAALHN